MAKKKTDTKKIVRQLTPEKDISTLLKQCKSAGKQTAEINGSLREKIAYAVDKKHLHKKAFATVRSLDKMEAEDLAAFFDHFDHYCDVSGLRERAESAPALELDEGETSEDGKVTRGKFSDENQAAAGGTPG